MVKEAKREESHKGDNSFGVASTILGIFGLLSIVPVYGIISGIIGLIFANKQSKNGKNSWSKAGKILNILAIVLNIVVWIFFAWLTQTNPELMAKYGVLSGK